MKNLFVLHTQYNLILACGLAKTDFSNERCDLILFQDFRPSEDTENRFRSCMDSVLILEGNWQKKSLSTKEKADKIRHDCKSISEFTGDTSYDRVFIVDDMCIQEMYVLKVAHKNNASIQMAWLEDGGNAYFDNGVVSGGMGATPAKRFIRKYALSAVYGLWGYYDLGSCMGSHKLLKKGYFTFPESVRAELADQEHVEISDEAFEAGMEALYSGKPYVFDTHGILIAMDKLDVYGNDIEKVGRLISDTIRQAKTEGRTVYYKYHPRESDRLPALEGETELDRNIALESYLTNSNTKDITVIGIKSTSLQTAKKMGYETISFIKSVEPDNKEIVKFYNAIGIECR